MPFTYSIAQGIIFGILSFVVIKIFSGRYKDVSIAIFVISVILIIKLTLDAVHFFGE